MLDKLSYVRSICQTQYALFHYITTTKEEGDSEGEVGLAHPHEKEACVSSAWLLPTRMCCCIKIRIELL